MKSPSELYQEQVEAAADEYCSDYDLGEKQSFKAGVEWAIKNPPPEFVARAKADKLAEALKCAQETIVTIVEQNPKNRILIGVSIFKEALKDWEKE